MTQSNPTPHWPPPSGPPTPGVPAPGVPAPGAPAPASLPIRFDGPAGWEVQSTGEADQGRRWGMGDLLLGLPVIFVGIMVGTVVGVAIEGTLDPDILAAAPAVIACGAIGQQLAMALWPIIVARWKGNGAAADFGFQFAPSDFVLGPVLAVGMGLAAFAVAAGLATALGVTESDEVSNTAILTDNRDSPWFWVIVAVTVIGAPLSEELFFRGLAMRSIEKRFNPVAGIIGSSVLFVLPHFTAAPWRETLVLFGSLAVVAFSLALMVNHTRRLGTSILAHGVFNLFSVLVIIFGVA